MGRGNHEGGLHEESSNGEFITVNNTENPNYPDDSYYVSYGTRDNHVTVIHDSGGNVIDVSETSKDS